MRGRGCVRLLASPRCGESSTNKSMVELEPGYTAVQTRQPGPGPATAGTAGHHPAPHTGTKVCHRQNCKIDIIDYFLYLMFKSPGWEGWGCVLCLSPSLSSAGSVSRWRVIGLQGQAGDPRLPLQTSRSNTLTWRAE